MSDLDDINIATECSCLDLLEASQQQAADAVLLSLGERGAGFLPAEALHGLAFVLGRHADIWLGMKREDECEYVC
jgi:hypothetical protein